MSLSNRYLLTGLLCLSALSCKHSNQSQGSATSAETFVASYRINPNKPKLCTAVRGNGPLIWGHFGAMANILENEGLIEGSGGGSSASISTFLYESILSNPTLWKNCAKGSCSSQEVADRAAFLVKTMPYWLEVAKNSNEGVALGHVIELSKVLKNFDINSLGSDNLVVLHKAFQGLRTLLTSSTVKSLINPAFIDFISPLKETGLSTMRFRAKETKEELLKFGKFSAENSNILFRPGIVDFKGLTAMFGRIGDFYAGNDPVINKSWPELMNACTEYARKKSPWDMVPSDCYTKFSTLVAGFLSRPASEANHHRVDDIVGGMIPAIASTAVLVGQSDLMAQSRDKYIHAQDPEFSLPKDSVFFGYTSSPKIIAKLTARIPENTDTRSRHFLSLGTMYWGDMLAVSPAEPGLAGALPFEDGDHNNRMSFGGWSDLSPVQAMKAMDCEKIIYVTREGEDSSFAQGVAGLVGFGEVIDELYSLKNKDSSYARALEQADAVYCTKWNNYKGTSFQDVKDLFNHAYSDSVLYKDERVGAPLGCARVL